MKDTYEVVCPYCGLTDERQTDNPLLKRKRDHCICDTCVKEVMKEVEQKRMDLKQLGGVS